MSSICGITVAFPGAKRPLEEGKKLGFWDLVIIDESGIKIPPADIYIFGAWHPAYEQIIGLAPDSKIGVLWTSSPGEMDFVSVEQEYLRKILNDPRIDFVWFGHPVFGRLYPEKGFYAPYPIKVEGVKKPNVRKENIITLMCPADPKKNILNQLLAVKMIYEETDIVLHTNVAGYDYLLNPHMIGGLDCVRHSWLPDEDYHKLLTKARLNLACSWAETFNYNVAEAALMGTISIVSPTIPIPGIICKDVSNPVYIVEKIKECINTDYKEEVLKDAIHYLKFTSYEAALKLSEALNVKLPMPPAP
ncbi:hypothetical protein ES703_98312 [subsurface metagenome]